MSAAVERHAENDITGMQHRLEHGEVRLRAGVRLHIGVTGVKQLFSAINRQLFGDIHKFAAAVVTLAGIPFRVLVRQHRALRRQHTRAGVVFRSDQLDVIVLAQTLAFERLPQLRVESGYGVFRG